MLLLRSPLTFLLLNPMATFNFHPFDFLLWGTIEHFLFFKIFSFASFLSPDFPSSANHINLLFLGLHPWPLSLPILPTLPGSSQSLLQFPLLTIFYLLSYLFISHLIKKQTLEISLKYTFKKLRKCIPSWEGGIQIR